MNAQTDRLAIGEVMRNVLAGLAVGSILVCMASGVIVGLCWAFLLPGRWRGPSY